MTTAIARRRRRTERVRRVGAWAGVAIVCVATPFLAFAASPMQAEAGPLAHAASVVTVTEVREGVVLTPDDPDGTGLVFFAGARVDPAAYADKLSGIAESGVTVVIARPALNFAILESRPLRTWTDRAPGVDSWAVGGHSLGGVRACMYADEGTVSALLLLGSYCSVDLSGSGLSVLSLAGGNDGLSTPRKIADASGLLPAGTRFETIRGAAHAQFGDYGVQSGDGPHDADDADVRDAITEAFAELAQTPR